MKVSAESLASILSTICGRDVQVIKAPDEDSDDEVRLSDQTWIQVGHYYAIVFRKVNGQHLKQDVDNVYETLQALHRLDPDALVPQPDLLQF